MHLHMNNCTLAIGLISSLSALTLHLPPVHTRFSRATMTRPRQILLVLALALGLVAGQTSCLDLFNLGQTASGSYTITTRDTNTSLLVTCDMTRYGGGWTRVQHHDFSTGALFPYGVEDLNVADPSNILYSIISHLPEFKNPGAPYEFLMEWPNTDKTGVQRWLQPSISSGPPANFVPISLAYNNFTFTGLQNSNHWQAIYSGSNNTWAYAVVQSGTWGGALFGPGGPVNESALWVRAVQCDPACATCYGPSSFQCLTCASGLTTVNNGMCANITGMKFTSH